MELVNAWLRKMEEATVRKLGCLERCAEELLGLLDMMDELERRWNGVFGFGYIR